jgi:hypothetical protein
MTLTREQCEAIDAAVDKLPPLTDRERADIIVMMLAERP